MRQALVSFMLAIAVLAAFAFLAPAMAQDSVTVSPSSTSTTITLRPLWDGLVPYIVAGLGSLVTVAAGWAALQFQRLTGIKIDDSAREALHSAAMTGVNLAISKLGSAAGNITIDVKSQIIAQALQWVQSSVPDAIKRFGLTPADLQKLIESKIPVAAAVPVAVVSGPGVK